MSRAPDAYLSVALRVGCPLAALGLIFTSRRPGLPFVWFLCGRSEGEAPSCRQTRLSIGFAVAGLKFKFDCSCSQCYKSALASAPFQFG